MPKLTAVSALLVVALLAVAACGGSAKLLTAKQVQDAFAAQRVRLHVFIDSRTLTEKRIDELTRIAPGDSSLARLSKRYTHISLERIRVYAARHPVLILTASLAATDVEVLVWGREADAERDTTFEDRAAAPVRRAHIPFRVTRVRNVEIRYSAADRRAADVGAAISRLH